MDSTKNKREVNGVVWFFLALSMLATTIGVFTNFLDYSNYARLGGGYPYIYLTEAIIDILILLAGFFTFKKKPFGLIALIVLFVIRLFACIPWQGDVSNAYLFGGKSALFLRDFGLFAIVMCFRKNGIAGWRAFFASNAWIEEHYKYKSYYVQETNLDAGIVSNDFNESETYTADISPNEQTEECPQEVKHDQFTGKTPQRINNGNNPTHTRKFKWWYVAAAIGVLTVMLFLFLIFRPYPNYITNFGEKWKYTWHLPNNSIAKRLYEEAMKHHPNRGFVIIQNGKPILKLGWDVYHERDLYRNSKVYAIKGEKVKSREEVVDSGLYLHHIISYGNYDFSILSGSDLISRYDEFEDSGLNLNDPIAPFDIDDEYKAEKQLMDIVADIPVTNVELVQDVKHYYDEYGNTTLLNEFFDNNYRYNKNNPGFLYEYTDILLRGGQYDKTKDIANYLLKKDAKDTKALSVLAYTAFCENNWDEAERYARKAVDYGAEEGDPYFILAGALYKSGAKQEAQRYYYIGKEKKYSPLQYTFQEAGGCPFEIKSMEFAFKNYNDGIITNYGQKLYSRNSQFIAPRIYVTLLRVPSTDDVLQCKLFRDGHLETGDDSPNGYTFEWTNNLFAPKGTNAYLDLTGWGAPYSGVWPSGNYRFEVYYHDELIGEKSFRIY